MLKKNSQKLQPFDQDLFHLLNSDLECVMNRTDEFKLLGRRATPLAQPMDINAANGKLHKLYPRTQLKYTKRNN